jgi:hypothetical protein
MREPYCVDLRTGSIVFLDEGDPEPQRVAGSLDLLLALDVIEGRS